MDNVATEKRSKFISKPLFMQSLKSLWVLWLALTIGAAGIFVIINVAIGSKSIFTNINMNDVSVYVKDEGLSWLKVLGLLEKMGFNLNRIQIMSQIDLNSILNELIFKIAGVLLPMIYVMIASNKLICAQVSDGSMAYVLSTPTNRKTVIRTQFVFLLASIFAMYIVITASAFASDSISKAILFSQKPELKENWAPLSTILYCVGSFASMFCLAGICFGASSFFNKSNYSVAVGGGVCVLSFLCCILGLFGNEVFVAVGIGVKSMYFFNYLSVFTLMDTASMTTFSKAAAGIESAFSYNWIWEIAILFVVGAVVAYFGGRVFTKKDLPL